MTLKDIRQVEPYIVERSDLYKEAMILYNKILKRFGEEEEQDIGMLVEIKNGVLYGTIVYEIADKDTKEKTLDLLHSLVPMYLEDRNVIYRVSKTFRGYNFVNFQIYDYDISKDMPSTIAPLNTELDSDFEYRKNPYGKVGAGILFICEEDNTLLLMHRSGDVEEPYTWGVPGGAVIGEGFHDWYFDVEPYTDEELWDGAKRETYEECGEIPPNLSDDQIRHVFDFRRGDFLFRDFVVVISKEQKDNWDIDVDTAPDAWENIDFGWFTLETLPRPLHMGVKFIFSHLGLGYLSQED